MSMHVRMCLDANGNRQEVRSDEEVFRVLQDQNSLIWIDIDKDDLHDLAGFQSLLHLHPLAIEDAQSANERPIFHRYGPTFFLRLYEIVVTEDGQTAAFPVSFFVGKNFVISARDIERSTLDDVVKRWTEFEDEVQRMDAGFLLYVLVDALVDNYFPAMDLLRERLEMLEDQIEMGAEDGIQRNVHAVRKEIFSLHRVIAPGREVLNELLRRDTPLLPENILAYFHDVYDHILRVLDTLDAYRDIAGTLFEMQLAMQSHRLDKVMRTLTVASIVLMISSLIAGIYGMNFQHMPELSWKIGYPAALGLMVVLDALVVFYFRRKRWV